MSTTRHPIDIEPEVRVMVETLAEDREYAITPDLVAHEIVRQGGRRPSSPTAFYDAATGRECGLAFAGDYIRLNRWDVRELVAAVRDGQAGYIMSRTIRSMNAQVGR